MAKRKLITSVINHNIRVELGLNCDEYIVMDILLENYCKQPFDFRQTIKDATGINHYHSEPIINELIKYKMLFISFGVYIISDKWLSRFNVDADFQEFWSLFREYGNKANSLKNYKIVRKSVDRETLHSAAVAYLAYCDEKYSDQKYVNPAQTWLDPKAKRWEDKLKMIQPASQDLPKRIHEFV